MGTGMLAQLWLNVRAATWRDKVLAAVLLLQVISTWLSYLAMDKADTAAWAAWDAVSETRSAALTCSVAADEASKAKSEASRAQIACSIR